MRAAEGDHDRGDLGPRTRSSSTAGGGTADKTGRGLHNVGGTHLHPGTPCALSPGASKTACRQPSLSPWVAKTLVSVPHSRCKHHSRH